MEIAAHNNPGLNQKYAEYQAALQKIPQVATLPDPELSVGVFLNPMELINGKQISDIRLMQMFPWFGVLKNGKDEMSLMAKAKFELFRDTKLQLFFDISRTWYEIYLTRRKIEYSGKNLEILNSIERLELEKLKTGTISGVSESRTPVSENGSGGMDNSGMTQNSQASSSMEKSQMPGTTSRSNLIEINRLKIESGDLRNDIESLNKQLQSLTVMFNSYLNRSPLADVSLPDLLPADSLGIPATDILDSLQAGNPMISMAVFEKQSADAKKRMVSKMGYPMVGIGLNYSLIKRTEIPMGEPSMNGKDMLMPMMSVTLPIYRKKYTAMKNEAAYLEDAADYNINSVKNELINMYFQAIQSYEDANRKVKLYHEQLTLSTSSLEIITKNFSTSSADMADVLRARQLNNEYEMKQIEAITDLNTSTAWLRRLGGIGIKSINNKDQK